MDIDKIVYDAIKEIVNEEEICSEISDETELTREIGIDSMGIVTLILLLEEKLEIDLDAYLVEIRMCKCIKDLKQLLIKIRNGELA